MKEDAAEGRWDDVLDSVARIERATLRMGDLIEDLLQLSRIGVIRNDPELVDVEKLLGSIAEELAERLQQANASLDIQSGLPMVFADRVRLAEVFENLLSNAIKYGCRSGNGRIIIGGKTGDGEVLYYVKDNGPGIAKEFHQKIFGLFQRLESNQEGTGVGLRGGGSYPRDPCGACMGRIRTRAWCDILGRVSDDYGPQATTVNRNRSTKCSWHR